MRKITLPLVMITSLATLVSCGETNNVPVQTSPQAGPVVTGAVANSATPVTLTRKETVSYTIPAPGKSDMVEFDVTIVDGIITTASAVSKADHEYSKNWQGKFIAQVSSKVVGKKAKDLKVDAIGGASLTTLAFETFIHSF